MAIEIRRTVALVVISAIAGACDAAGGDPMPAEERPPAVEGIADSVLAVLPPGVTRELLQEGRRLYPTCSVCHGEDARGTQLGPPLRGPDWIHITGGAEEIEAITRVGVSNPSSYPVPMPPMGGGSFDDQQLRALAAYLDALGRSER
jgi:mono/diheme cytochrome c family protein